MSDLSGLSDWLAATPLSSAIADREWAVPTLQSVHILAVGIVLASIAMVNLRLAGILQREDPLRSSSDHFFPWIWGALAVLVSTGILQVAAEPARELLNWIFLTKMGLLVLAAAGTALNRGRLEERRFAELPAGRRGATRALALVTLLLWVAIVICGRWIAYAGGAE
jgi:putative copper export protein